MKRIAFIGNSCTGKTTAAFSVIAALKRRRALTAYCSDVCRFVSFNPDRFDVDPYARLHVLYAQYANECEQLVRLDADYLVTERTVLDWCLYYEWTCKNVGKRPDAAIRSQANGWATEYDLIFFMDSESMEYHDDGFRPPSTRIRDEIDSAYRCLLEGLRFARLHTDRKLVVIEGDDLDVRTRAVLTALDEWLADGNLVVRPSRMVSP